MGSFPFPFWGTELPGLSEIGLDKDYVCSALAFDGKVRLPSVVVQRRVVLVKGLCNHSITDQWNLLKTLLSTGLF